MPELPLKTVAPESVVIACGGTGGHLFPGLAVGGELHRRGYQVTLMVSPKSVDQQAIKNISDREIVTLPAVGWQRRNAIQFLRGFWQSYRIARACFSQRRPRLVLAMGGFLSAAPILAARRSGIKTFLHESNSIPGRANRYLARLVEGVFLYFSGASERLAAPRLRVTGMPVRPEFFPPVHPTAARLILGLDPDAPVLLIMGGSQGADGVNQLALRAAPLLRQNHPRLQFLHMTGDAGLAAVKEGYRSLDLPAQVHAFFPDMGMALAAADAAISRAGASSLAELAARQLPSVLIPYPAAADNHQFYNARAFVQTGAARMLEQAGADPAQLAVAVDDILAGPSAQTMRRALAQWHFPTAASDIAEHMLSWPQEHAQWERAPKFKPSQMGSLNV